MGTQLSLYELTNEHKLLCELLEENGGEITPEIEEMLAINADNFVVKAEGYAEMIAYYSQMADVAKARKQQMDNAQKVFENAAKRMKERMLQAMLEYDLPKVEIGLHKLTVRSSKAVEITDEAKIPNNYIKVATSIDKSALRADLMAGKVVEGAELKENKSLTIR